MGIKYGVADTDLALQIPQTIIGYRDSFRNRKIKVIQSVLGFGKSVTMSVIGWGGFWATVSGL